MSSDKRSDVQHIEVDADLAGQRIDNFLIKMLKGLPKSRIYRIIRKGEVRINGKRVKPESRLMDGDRVRIPPIMHLPERKIAAGHFHDLDSLILFEDKQLLIINKPAGMAVHGGSGVTTGVIESLRAVLPEGDRLELVHRLDRGTSGCLMVAKRRSYLRLLQDALRRPGTISKQYKAVVSGTWPAKLKTIEEPLLTTSTSGTERVTRVNASGKSAKTQFDVIKSNSEFSLLTAAPLTGRTHQIRVHARWARHPIVGDDRYGGDQDSGGRLMLHAGELRIPKLEDHEAVVVRAPWDERFEQFVQKVFSLRQDDIKQ